jgi:23S rRNA (cytosine1962-C5)-methyltransferase
VKPRRYQLRKDAVAIAGRGHPWIFREQMSTAASVLADGQWLRLVDGANQIIGHGIYEAEGAIAIRMLRRGAAPVDAAFVRGRVTAALGKRAGLAEHTDAIRLIHGESDGIPAVVVDRFADTLVIASYSTGSDALARYVARVLAGMHRDGTLLGDAVTPEVRDAMHAVVGPATNIVLRPARRRRGPPLPARVLAGTAPEVIRFTEHGLPLAVDLAGGHKTGTYLDLRALRHAVATAPLAGARVLNLFAYTGMLGRAAEAAGAADITQVDTSDRALGFAAAHHVTDASRHHFVTADAFDYIPALAADELYDLVIIDPPAMTSQMKQVPRVLAAYRKLYEAARTHVRPGGVLVSACCTSRVERAQFVDTVRKALGAGYTLERDIAPEPDHPVGFPQADYLKILWWRRS